MLRSLYTKLETVFEQDSQKNESFTDMSRPQSEESWFRDEQQNYSNRCREYVKLSHDSRRSFVPYGASRHVLKQSGIEGSRLMNLISDERGDTAEILRRIFGDAGGAATCTILLIIICCGSLNMLRQFPPGDKTDDDLPFDKQTARRLFGDDEGETFYRNQFSFAAFVLREGQYYDGNNDSANYADEIRMPYLSEEEIGKGAYGTVSRVKISGGHFHYKNDRSRNMDVWHPYFGAAG